MHILKLTQIGNSVGVILPREANHPFVDGNKRAAFLAAGLFLHLNGLRLKASQVEATLVVVALAAGELPESEFAAWLREHSGPR